MRVLLDTQALLWWLSDDARLGPKARRVILSDQPVISPVILWEIAIKASLGKLRADVAEVARVVTEQGFERIGILDAHVAAVGALPFHHRDPFDRMIIAQGMVEGMPVLTSDAKVGLYEVEVLGAEI